MEEFMDWKRRLIARSGQGEASTAVGGQYIAGPDLWSAVAFYIGDPSSKVKAQTSKLQNISDAGRNGSPLRGLATAAWPMGCEYEVTVYERFTGSISTVRVTSSGSRRFSESCAKRRLRVLI
jgi:hypothetical protein